MLSQLSMGNESSRMPAVAEGRDSLAKIASALNQIHDLEEEDDRLPGLYDTFSEKAFEELESPTEEAKSDPDRFLAKYFLDQDGEPAPGDYQEAFVLWVDGLETGITTKVEDIPGLKAYCSDLLKLTVVGWSGRAFERGLDEAFSRVSEADSSITTPVDTPDAEAIFSVERFLAKYFRNGIRGRPDKRKTPQPVQLKSWVYENNHVLRESVRSMYSDGLRRAKAKTKDGHVVIIGWGGESVRSWARGVEIEAERKIESEEVSTRTAGEEQRRAGEIADFGKVQERYRVLRDHERYVMGPRAPTGASIIENFAGSYVFECPEISERWPGHDTPMTLDVQAPSSTFGTKAAFSLGVLEGTMLLGTTEVGIRLLEQEIEEAEKNEKGELGEPHEHKDALCHVDVHGVPEAGRAAKRKAHGQPGSSRPVARRRLESTARPNRVLLRWRGRGTVTGEIEGVYSQRRQVGYLDVSADGLTGKGKMAHPSLFDKRLHIKIYKMGSEPRNRSTSWSELSGSPVGGRSRW